jgi:hypothetical protein
MILLDHVLYERRLRQLTSPIDHRDRALCDFHKVLKEGIQMCRGERRMAGYVMKETSFKVGGAWREVGSGE